MLTTLDDFARDLRSHRRSIRMTGEELARRIGVSQAFVSQLENGRRRPSFKTLEQWVAALGLSLEVHLEPQEDEPKLPLS